MGGVVQWDQAKGNAILNILAQDVWKGGRKQAVSRVLFPVSPPSRGCRGDGGGSSLSNRRCRRPPAAHIGRSGNWPTFAPRAEALALLPTGVYQAGTSRCRWCALTAPLHPCLIPQRGHWRCVSVALSSRFPALGVTQQVWPLGSPDFPQPDSRSSRDPRRTNVRPCPRAMGPVAITSPAFHSEV
jgi:hypothetical protein